MLSEPFQGIFLMCASALAGAGDTPHAAMDRRDDRRARDFSHYVLIFGKFGFPALGGGRFRGRDAARDSRLAGSFFSTRCRLTGWF